MAVIVADIHGDIEKTHTFLNYRPEELHIALGDYLDSYLQPFDKQLECLKVLMDSGSELLLGNHEVHYLTYPMFQFPGYQPANADTFQRILESRLSRFKVAYSVDGWLLTHAGVNSIFTERESDVNVLSDTFNSSWELYLKQRLVDREAQYPYKSIFEFNHVIFVEGNLLSENIRQILGHAEHLQPIVEPHYIALDTTNHSDSCWVYDTTRNELVDL